MSTETIAERPGVSGTGRLRRAITGLTNGAMTYACAGITAGIYSLFAFSLGASGPAFFWGWLIVGVSVLLACLVYAELASHYPFAASIYHWPLLVGGRTAGWWVGWLYLGALLPLVASYAIVMPAILGPLFGFTPTPFQVAAISVTLILLAFLLNLLGIDVLGRLAVYGVAAELAVLFVLSALVFILGPHRPPSFLLETGGTGSTLGDWLPGFLGGGMFVGLWALFTFETAGTLGEETIDARRQAPRAVLGSLLVSVAAGTFFIALILLSTPSLSAAMKSGTPIQDAITATMPAWVAQLYLVVMAWVIFLAINALFTATCRHIFGMARAGQLPFSTLLSRTRANGEPWIAGILVLVATSLPILFVTQNLTVLVTGAIAAMYVPYVLVLAVTLGGRLRGWPRERAPFSLGRWGVAINVLAVIAAVATLVDLGWPRDTTNPVWQLNIRVAYWLVGIPAVIGAVYYLVWQRSRLGAAAPIEAAAEAAEIPAANG